MKHSTASQWYVNKTSQWYVSATPHLVRLQDVSCNSQMKHPITSLWYVSTTSRSYVVVTPCLYYGLYYVFKLLCHDLHLVGFQVSFTHQIKHHIFLVPTRRETRGVVWIINQQNFYYIQKLIHTCINNICNISCEDIYKFLNKIIYGLKKEP